MNNVIKFPARETSEPETLPLVALRYPGNGSLVLQLVDAPAEGIEMDRRDVALLVTLLGAFLETTK